MHLRAKTFTLKSLADVLGFLKFQSISEARTSKAGNTSNLVSEVTS